MGAQAARNRRAGAGGECRIQAVDVEGQVHGPVTHHVPDDPRHFPWRHGVHAGGIQHRHGRSRLALEDRADADLHAGLFDEQAFRQRLGKDDAVVDASFSRSALHIPVRIEMHQRHRAVPLHHGTQHGQRNEVITSEDERHGSCLQNSLDMGARGGSHVLRSAPVPVHVSGIDDPQPVERIEAPRPDRAPIQLQRLLADGARAEPRSGPVGRRHVEWHPGHHHVRLREDVRDRAAHEGRMSGIGSPLFHAASPGPSGDHSRSKVPSGT